MFVCKGKCEGWADGAFVGGYSENFLVSDLMVKCEGSGRPSLDHKSH